MTLKLISGPAVEPITLAEAKAQCRVDGTDEDALITAMIAAAREQCEHEIGRALIEQTWRRSLDAFPEVEIELGMPPVISITSVVYTDTAGANQTLAGAAYVLDTTQEPGWVLPASGYDWPATLDCAGAVRVTFVAGYGSDATTVPNICKAWIKQRVAQLYKFREPMASGMSVAEIPKAYVDGLLDRYRAYL